MPQDQLTEDQVLDALVGASANREDTTAEVVQRGMSNFTENAGTFVAGSVDFLGIIENKVGKAAQALSKKADVLSFLDPVGKDLETRGEMIRAGGQLISKAATELIDNPISKARGGLVGFLSQDAAGAAGSLIPLVATAGAPALGMLMAATAMGAQEFADQEARDPENEGKQWLAMLGGLGLGATEMLPVSRMLGRINARSGGQLKKLLIDRILDSGEEGFQEVLQALGSNAIAKFIGQEDRDLSEGVLRSGLAGAFVAPLVGIAGSGVNRSLNGPQSSTDTDFTTVGTSTPGGIRPNQFNQDFSSVSTSTPGGDFMQNATPAERAKFSDLRADPRSVESAPPGSLSRLRETGGPTPDAATPQPQSAEQAGVKFVGDGVDIDSPEFQGEVQHIPPMDLIEKAAEDGKIDDQEQQRLGDGLKSSDQHLELDANGIPFFVEGEDVTKGNQEEFLAGLRELGFIRDATKEPFAGEFDTTDPQSGPDSGVRTTPQSPGESSLELDRRVANQPGPQMEFNASDAPFVEQDISDGTELVGQKPDPLGPIRDLLPAEPAGQKVVVGTEADTSRFGAGEMSPADAEAEARDRKLRVETARKLRDRNLTPTESSNGGRVASEGTPASNQGNGGDVVGVSLDVPDTEGGQVPQAEGAKRQAPSATSSPKPTTEGGPVPVAETVEGQTRYEAPGRSKRITVEAPEVSIPEKGSEDAASGNLSRADIDPEFLKDAVETGKELGPDGDEVMLHAGIFPLVKLPGIESVKRFFRKNLRPRGNNPKEIYDDKLESEAWYSGQMEQVKITARDFDAAMKRVFGKNARDTSVMEVIDTAFKNVDQIDKIPDAELRGLVRKMRDHTDLLSRRMIADGVVEGDMALRVAENIGLYATRSFRVFSDPDWMKKLDPRIRNRFKSLLRSEYITTRRKVEIQERFDEAAERSVTRQLRSSKERTKRIEQFSKGELRQIVAREKKEIASLKRLAKRISETAPDGRADIVAQLEKEVKRFKANAARVRVRLENNLGDPIVIAGGKQGREAVFSAERRASADLARLKAADKARTGVLDRLLELSQNPGPPITNALLAGLDETTIGVDKAIQGVGRRLNSKIQTEQRNTLRRIEATRERAKQKAAVRIKKESRPFAEGLTDGEIEGYINSLIVERLPGQNPLAALSQRVAGSKDLSILKRRKELSPEFMALMGENRSAQVNYAQSIANMGQLIANHRFLSEARVAGEKGGFFHKKPVVIDGVSYDTRIAAEGSPSLKPLDGIYTTSEIKAALEEQFKGSDPGAILRPLIQLNGLVKLGKTVGSPMTHVRNFFGNVGFALANAHLTLNPRSVIRSAKATARAARRTQRAGSAFDRALGKLSGETREEWETRFVRAAELGVVSDGAASGAVKDLVDDVWGSVDYDPLNAHASTMKRALKGTAQAAAQVYQLSDDAWKLNAWEAEITNMREAFPNETTEQIEKRAADRVLAMYPTYSRIPTLVKEVRKFPFTGAFVSFPAEIVRISANTVDTIQSDIRSSNPVLRRLGAQRLAGTIAAASLPAALAAMSRIFNGMDSEDDDNARLFVPPWSRNSTIVWIGRDGPETMEYLDLSYVDPYSYIKDTVMALLRGQDTDDAIWDAFSQAASPWLGEDILFSAVVDVLRNTKQTGGRVYDAAATWDDKAKQVLDHLGKAAEPGFASQARRVHKGWNNEVATFGKKYDLETELWAVFSGMRRSQIDLPSGVTWKAGTFTRMWSNSSQSLSQGLTAGTREMSDDDIRSLYETTENQRRDAFRTIYRATQAAQALGMTAERTLEQLGKGMSKSKARDVMDGIYRPYNPSRSFMKTNINRSTLERAAEFRRRIEVLEEIAADAEPVRLPQD